jgi:hypothetical protein
MTGAEIVALIWCVGIIIVLAVIAWMGYDCSVTTTIQDIVEKHRTKNKNKIVKELRKLDKKPDLILCEPYHLEARFDDMLTDIIGVPIVYAGLSGKPYVFVWLTDSAMKLNEQCEKILKEQKR